MSQSELTKLLKRVRDLTAARGDKVGLARRLGVRPQRLNDWLSGNNTPSGETALRLLKWVTIEEAQQKKRAGSASTRPALKTRNSKSTTNENAKSDPKRH